MPPPRPRRASVAQNKTGVPFVPAGVLVPFAQEHLRRPRAGLASGRQGLRLYRAPKGEKAGEQPLPACLLACPVNPLFSALVNHAFPSV